jgi:ABC-type branched-subunit amino acid transport system ATPase component
VIEFGKEFDLLMLEFTEKQVSFATNRIIAGVQQSKPHAGAVFSSNKAEVFYRISVTETLEIGPLVKLKKEEIVEEKEIVSAIVGFKSRFSRRISYWTGKNPWLTVTFSLITVLMIGLLDYRVGVDIELSI